MTYQRVLNNADLVGDIVLSICRVLIIKRGDCDSAVQVLAGARRDPGMHDLAGFAIQAKDLEAAVAYHRGRVDEAKVMHQWVVETLRCLELKQDTRDAEAMWPLLTDAD